MYNGMFFRGSIPENFFKPFTYHVWEREERNTVFSGDYWGKGDICKIRTEKDS